MIVEIVRTPWMKPEEAAEYIRRKKSTLYRLIKEGKIPTYHIDGHPLIRASDLDKYIEAHK